MSEMLTWTLAAAAGLGMGGLFFAGLRWTVERGLASRRPALWFLGSMLLRVGLVTFGMYVVGGGRWQALLACLLGFVVARELVTRRARPRLEGRHGPHT